MKAQIYHYHNWINETRPELLRPLFTDMLHDSGFQVLGFNEHHFLPHGYTCLWLLGESHLALHTFPEQGSCYIDLSSCNELMHQFFVDRLERHASLSVLDHSPIVHFLPNE